jgi:hypothetical protein
MGLVCLVLLSFLVPTGCISATDGPSAPSVAQPVSETRAGKWVQTTAVDWSAGDREGIDVTNVAGGELCLSVGATRGTYVSPIVESDFAYNAVVAHWSAHVPQGTSLEVELRSFDQVNGWSAWQPFVNVEWVALKGEYYPEAPLMVAMGRRFQYRLSMAVESNRVPLTGTLVLYEMTITYLDTSAGPTTAQAKFRMQAQHLTAHGVSQPPIISRAGWGADESIRDWEPEIRPVRKMVVHHTVTPNDYDEDQATAWVRAIYHYHAVTLGWGDVGYNYLVDQYGNIYEGRYGGPGVVGGHVYSYNYGSVGIGLIGTHGNTGNSAAPTAAALEAVRRLCVWEASRSYIHPLENASFFGAAPPNLGGHRDYPPNKTTCPGDLGYATLPGLRQEIWDGLVAALPRYQVAWLNWDTSSDALKQGVIETGQVYSLTLRVRNTGWYAWPHAGGQDVVRLGYRWLDSGGQVVALPPGDDLRTPLERGVAYGNTHEFPSAKVVAPATPGTYRLVWDLLHEGVTWFHDANAKSPRLTTPMTVVSSPLGDSGAVRNGGFEQDGDWTLFFTAYPARFTGRVRRTGARSLQTGIEVETANVFSYSSAEQTFRVPSVGDLVLRYWHKAEVEDGDFGYVYLRPEGGAWRVLHVVRRDVPAWTEVTHDLSGYAGQRVTLRFGTFNNGSGGVSAIYLDDVSLAAAPSPEPTPTPLPCAELVANGGFESDSSWVIYDTPRDARYSTAMARTGERSMRLGIVDPTENTFSYSSAEQQVSIPEGQRSTLSLWYNAPQGGGQGDYGYFLIRPGDSSWRILRIVQEATGGWVQMQEDVSHLSGQSITLRLGMRNDGGVETASLYVDDVSLQACRP